MKQEQGSITKWLKKLGVEESRSDGTQDS